MSLLIDITDDISKKCFAQYTDRVTLPDYVKSALVASTDECVKLSSECFADSIHRKFPIDSKSNCWMSALYFYGGQHNNNPALKQAAARIDKWSNIWGIANDLNIIKLAFTTQAEPMTYALSMTFNGKTINRCPDHSPESATKSAEWLYANRNAFPIAVQKQAAIKLMKKADLSAIARKAAMYLEKLSNGEAYNTMNVKLAGAIVDRLHAVPTPKWGPLGQELMKSAQALGTKPYALCADPAVYMSAVEAFDVAHNLQTKWGRSLEHPVDVCYSYNLVKSAKAIQDIVQLTTGETVDLAKVSYDQLEKGLKMAGDDFLDYCKPDGFNIDKTKAAEVLPTLPKPEAQRFERGIKSAGYTGDATQLLIETLDHANKVY